MLRQAIIAFVVLIVVIGDLIYYKMKDPNKVEDPNNVPTGEVSLINMDPSAIETVEMEDNTNDDIKIFMKLRNTEEGLKVEERRATYKTENHDKDLDDLKPLSENEIKLIEISLTELKALSVIDENATDVEQYGMNDPMCLIKITLKDGTVNELRVGDKIPTSTAAYYFMMNNNKKIYVISEFDVKNFFNPSDNIIDI